MLSYEVIRYAGLLFMIFSVIIAIVALNMWGKKYRNTFRERIEEEKKKLGIDD